MFFRAFIFSLLILSKNTRWLIDPSKITIESPAKTLETRNNIGINSLYQSGWILAFAIKNSAPKPDWCNVDKVYGETAAGGTGYLYLSPIPHEQLGFDTRIQNSSYPALTKGFLFSVPSVFVLVPTLLLGIHEATKRNNSKRNNDEDYE